MCDKCQEDTHQKLWDQKNGISRRTLLAAGATTAVVLAMGDTSLVHASTLADPTIASTSTWRAQPPRGTIVVLPHKANKILVHHTTDVNTTDYSLGHAYDLARRIQQEHFANGWIDSGQHFTISRGGYIMEGRHRSLEALRSGNEIVIGAHSPGENDQAIGIEDEGTYDSVLPTAMLLNSLVNMCAYVCQQYGLNASNIFGHRDFTNTDCPGVQFYGYLPTLRKRVAARLGQQLPPRTWPVYMNGLSGESVKSLQYLLRAHGYGITVDSSFGPGTEGTVRSFQSSRGLGADGIVGPLTWEALVIPVQNGSTGDAVSAVQSQLNWKGYGTGVDGQFGPHTEGSVRSFQTNQGVSITGAINLNTWCALVGGSAIG